MKNKTLLLLSLASAFAVNVAHASGVIICEPNGSNYLCDVHVSGVNPSSATYNWSGSGGIGVQGNQDSALVSCNNTEGSVNVTVYASNSTTTVSRAISCLGTFPPLEGERVFRGN